MVKITGAVVHQLGSYCGRKRIIILFGPGWIGVISDENDFQGFLRFS
jgi:hypothetical protein